MILAGLAFKVSAAPFHMWTPDVYQGSPTSVTAFMSAATKTAAMVVALRLLVTAFPDESDIWTIAVAVLACVSLAWEPRGARPARPEATPRVLVDLARRLLLIAVSAASERGTEALSTTSSPTPRCPWARSPSSRRGSASSARP